jgi:hypothetical protein
MDQKELWRLIGYLASHCTIAEGGKISIPANSPDWAKNGLAELAEHPELLSANLKKV